MQRDYTPIRYFQKHTKDIPWKTIFEGSTVKCEKCLNSIRASVLRQNPDRNVKSVTGKAPRLSFFDEVSNWSIKVAVEAKGLANDPTWSCTHLPDEMYFVEAIRMGVEDLMENYKSTGESGQCKVLNKLVASEWFSEIEICSIDLENNKFIRKM